MSAVTEGSRQVEADTRRVRSSARWPWWVVPLAIFLVTRVLGAAVLLLVARSQIPEQALLPGQMVPSFIDPPTYLHVITNWDGQWYRLIAENGYPRHLPMHSGEVQQNAWAFYPMFPLLAHLVMLTGASFGLAASIVNAACGGAMMCLLYRMLTPTCGRFAASMSVLALCTYPAAVTLQVGYSESVAMLLILVALWCLREQRYVALLVTGLVLAFTRPIVLPLALVVGAHWVARWRRRRDEPFPRGEAIGVAVVGGVIAASFIFWPIVVGVATGRSDAFFATQNAWARFQRAPGTHGWPSWLAVLVGGADVGFALLIALVVVVFGLLIARPAARLWGRELRTWAWAYPLYLLGSTRPTPSIIRYAMLAIVPWWPFPEVGRAIVGTRQRLGIALLVGALGLLSQYVWVRWFFAVTPHSIGFP